MAFKTEKILSIIDKIISQAAIIFFAIILILCSYTIYDALQIRNEMSVIHDASKIIDNIPDDARIAELQKINSDIKAWIAIDSTDIVFPILQTTNNQFYLTHNYKKEYSIAGSIFADYRSNLLSDDYAVVYGHNMNGDSMFGAINKYESADYFNTHRGGHIYLENGNRSELSVLAYAIVSNEGGDIYDVDKNANGANDVILQNLKQAAINSNFSTNANRLLLLSTCYGHSGQRAVLLLAYNN